MKKEKEWAQKEVDRYLSYEGVNEARNALMFAKGVINQLEEPEKPVIPQFMADWIESYVQKGGTEWDILGTVTNFNLDKLSAVDSPIYEWLKNKRGNFKIFLNAIANGYEVEKEKKYKIVFMEEPEFERTTYLAKDRNGILFIESGNTNLLLGVAYLTEAEIKAVDERFWQFAEPVEEEAE